MSTPHDTAFWDEDRARVTTECLGLGAKHWAQEIANMDLPEDLSDAEVAFRELRHCLGAMRDFGRS